MSRLAKIIIFSIILVFSIYNKQTSNDVSASNVNTKVNKKDTPKQYNTPPKNSSAPGDELFTDKKPVKGKYDDLGLIENPLKWFPAPKNGFSPYDKYFGKGIYDNNIGNEFIIKNSNSTDAVVLLVNAYTGRKVRNEFVSKGTDFKMTGVPDGTYYLEWFSGTFWSPELKVGTRFKGGFQSKASFTKTKDQSDWMSVDGYRQWTVTLYSVVGGDVESEKINADEFFN